MLTVLGIVAGLSLGGCGGSDASGGSGSAGTAPTQGTSSNTTPTSAATGASGKTLVVYFSHTGNTATVADWIAVDSGATTFRIQPVDAYPTNYNECLDVASRELSGNVRPAMADGISDISQYDTVFLGWPCWWGTCPRIVLTFLERYDLTGKTIIPFTTSGGTGFGTSLDEIRSAAPNASYRQGLETLDSQVTGSRDKVDAWVRGLGYSR